MDKKPRILLDLDSTLISAEVSKDFDYTKNKEKMKKFSHHDMDGYYIVFERPGLQKFLDWLFDNFIVSVWTAASKDYALFVVDKILLQKPGRKLDYIFFSYHCDLSKKLKLKGTKDLNIFWNEFKLPPGYLRSNTIIVDDYEEDVYKNQKDRCILADEFEFSNKDSEKDDFLEKLQSKLETVKKRVEQGDDNLLEGLNPK